MLIVDTPVETDRLLLRPFRLDDLHALHDLRTRPDVLRHLYWPPATVEQVREVIDQRLTMTKLVGDNDCLVLAVELRDTGRMVGEVDLRLSSVEHRHAELGVILHPDVQGRGFAAEAASALLDLAFIRMGLHRVIAQTNARNTASIRVLRKLGMRQEGHLRECVRFAGEWHDELIFAILAREWTSEAGDDVDDTPHRPDRI
jgi:aminoglycoside 6'-N-acetyltransferase